MYIHKLSDVSSNDIGVGTKVWQYAVILEDAKIGQNCNICSHVFIENKVFIGSNVTIKQCVQIWDGITIEDNVFIGPNVTFTNDKYPRSKNQNFELTSTIIKKNASIGANSTILSNLVIGENVIIGAGSVVTRSIPDNVIVYGNPAKVIRDINEN